MHMHEHATKKHTKCIIGYFYKYYIIIAKN